MIEVFKTNVNSREQAEIIIRKLEESFPGYKINFDLDDVDRILRIKNDTSICNIAVVALLESLGFKASVLPDEIPAYQHLQALALA